MQTFIVTVKDETRAAEFRNKLSQIEYVRFNIVRARKKQKHNGAPDFTKLFGLWKGRKISARSLRKKSWERFLDLCL